MQSEDFLTVAVLVPVVTVLLGVAFSVLSMSTRGPEDSVFMAHARLLLSFYARVVHRLHRRPAHDPLPATGGVILVANHRSGVDPIVVGAITKRRVHFLMAREYYETRGLRWLFRRLGAVPVNRDGHDLSATKAAIKLLRAGKVVGVFPQGGIRGPDDTEEPKAGVALLAVKTGAPVVPCHIDGSPAFDSVLRSMLTPSRTTVCVGEPLRIEASRKPSREELEQLTQHILEGIAAQAPAIAAGSTAGC